MRTTLLVAARAASLLLALLTAACVQAPAETSEADDVGGAVPGTEPIDEATQPAYESTFHFTEQVKDDGEGPAGGWQRATAILKFADWRKPYAPYFWQCPIEVGMPIRAALQGHISARYAARIAAEVATEVTETLMHSRPSWLGESATYCRQLYAGMQQMLKAPPYRIDARVKRP